MPDKDKQDRPYAEIDALQDGQTVWLDGEFPCHPPGPVTVHLTEDGAEPYFTCYEGEHYMEALLESGDNTHLVGIYLDDPGPLDWTQKNAVGTNWKRGH